MPAYDRNDPNDEYFGSHLNETGISPRGYRILVEIPKPSHIQKAENAGLALPETAVDAHITAAVVAKVIQLGGDCYTADKTAIGPWCKPGDYIAMSPYSGVRVKSSLTGKDYRFINDDTVDGVVISPEYMERG